MSEKTNGSLDRNCETYSFSELLHDNALPIVAFLLKTCDLIDYQLLYRLTLLNHAICKLYTVSIPKPEDWRLIKCNNLHKLILAQSQAILLRSNSLTVIKVLACSDTYLLGHRHLISGLTAQEVSALVLMLCLMAFKLESFCWLQVECELEGAFPDIEQVVLYTIVKHKLLSLRHGDHLRQLFDLNKKHQKVT